MCGFRGCRWQDHHGRRACCVDIQGRGRSICRLIGAVDEADDGDDRRYTDDYADERQDAARELHPNMRAG